MFAGNVDKLVLGTVNAPWKVALSAEALANSIAHSDIASSLPHIVTFYTEVAPELVVAFARQHRIPPARLLRTYDSMKVRTGEMNMALEPILGELATAA